MKRIAILSFVISLFCTSIFAEAPAGYYTNAKGKSKEALKTALSNIISSNYKQCSYDKLYTIYAESDVTDDGKVWDMYSTCSFNHDKEDRCGNYKNVCDCYNREHSIPQSWFNEKSPMKSDAFHVYPTDGKVNGQRSNYPFGECSGGTSLGGKALGRLGNSTFSGYSGKVFEPDDQYKGDFARTYFYFVTRYQSQMSSMSGDSFAKNTYPSLSKWSIDLFLKWHRQDPVSQKEIDRNDAVYSFQQNRNPFIDHPELAEYIWGSKMGQVWNGGTALNDNALLEGVVINTIEQKGTLHIHTEETALINYTIYSMTGRMMQQGTIQGSDNYITIPFPQGIYILQLQAGEETKTLKFSVQ
ncbi:MAG: endonuclease [Paludibacteraceae bacterium]|nr:endonuclease [Paludibacteraceae bacterium]